MPFSWVFSRNMREFLTSQQFGRSDRFEDAMLLWLIHFAMTAIITPFAVIGCIILFSNFKLIPMPTTSNKPEELPSVIEYLSDTKIGEGVYLNNGVSSLMKVVLKYQTNIYWNNLNSNSNE